MSETVRTSLFLLKNQSHKKREKNYLSISEFIKNILSDHIMYILYLSYGQFLYVTKFIQP